MKCDMNCKQCTRPASKCYGGNSPRTPYTHISQKPVRNGVPCVGQAVERVSTGRYCRVKPWDGWCAK